MRRELAVQEMLDVSSYTKAPEWSYEKEWRVLSFKGPMDTGHFTDYKYNPRELAGVYLGPLISGEEREGILRLAAHYPDLRAFDVSIGMSREFILKEIRL